jgi:hypothetical protein
MWYRALLSGDQIAAGCVAAIRSEFAIATHSAGEPTGRRRDGGRDDRRWRHCSDDPTAEGVQVSTDWLRFARAHQPHPQGLAACATSAQRTALCAGRNPTLAVRAVNGGVSRTSPHGLMPTSHPIRLGSSMPPSGAICLPRRDVKKRLKLCRRQLRGRSNHDIGAARLKRILPLRAGRVNLRSMAAPWRCSERRLACRPPSRLAAHA